MILPQSLKLTASLRFKEEMVEDATIEAIIGEEVENVANSAWDLEGEGQWKEASRHY